MSRSHIAATLFVAVLSYPAQGAWAAKPTTLWAFNHLENEDGAYPNSVLIADKSGDLFGVTLEGGLHGAGTVFMLSPPRNAGAAWSETILYAFTGENDGSEPVGGLALDKSGNLYGVTRYGGTDGQGTVFEVTPAGAETVLYSFTDGADGGVPYGSPLLVDGTIYGTTSVGGDIQGTSCSGQGCGVVYALAPAKGGGWQQTVLHTFEGQSTNDGTNPFGGLIAGADDALYGTTVNGGVDSNGGTVFVMTPKGKKGWSESIVYSLVNSDVQCPLATLSTDNSGALYGTGKCAGGMADDGGIFELTPPAKGQTAWSYATLYAMCQQANCDDGETPSFSGVTLLGGKLYGTATGGSHGHGVTYRLSPPAKGRTAWSEKVLYTFPEAKGNRISDPVYGVIAQQGSLYGVTNEGGSSSDTGAAYSIAP